MMGDSQFPASVPVARRWAPWIAAVVISGAGLGYAVHEHSNAQSLIAQNQQMTAQNQQMSTQLKATGNEIDALSAKVNALTTSLEPKPAPHIAPAAANHRGATRRTAAQDARFKKMQSQLDAQGKAIEDARNDLVSTRTELSGSIAKTHDELVVLEKKGERNYYEFDLSKSKAFKRTGPVSICLRKANTKHQYADLQFMVDDRNLSQKHVNLFQPVMYYQPDLPQPFEVVINQIDKDHIHGYVSAPKYRKSELNVASADSGSTQPGDSNAQPARQKLPTPSAEPNEQ